MTTEDEGFTPKQKSELAEMIAAATKGLTAPGGDPKREPPAAPPKLSDDEWLGMSIGQREAWVRRAVEGELTRIQREDDELRLRDELAQLKEKVDKEPEKAPTTLDKIRDFLWGKEPETANK